MDPSVAAPPLAPLRAPVLRPPPQNGEARTSISDSGDSDSEEPPRPTGVVSGGEYEISEESMVVRERQEKAMRELVMKRRASALAVPTIDMALRAGLGRLGEPITLFGEREMERRDRLRMIMARLDSQGELERLLKVHEEEEAAASSAALEDGDDQIVHYPFYTEGSKALLNARIDIAKYSIRRAASRLERARTGSNGLEGRRIVSQQMAII